MNCRYLLILLVLTFSITSSAQEMTEETVVDTTSIASSQMSNKEKAAAYLAAADQLLLPYSFMYAHELVLKSLQLDPSNKKAQFIKLYIEQLLPFKGSFHKFDALASTYEGKTLRDFQLYKSLPKPGGTLDRWMKDSSKVFKNEEDIQSNLIEVRDAAIRFRDFLKANPDASFSISYYRDLNIEKRFLFSLGATNLGKCDVTVEKPGVYKLSPCHIRRETVKIEMVDIEILRQEVSLMIAYAVIYTGYTLEGWIEVDRMEDLMRLSDKDIFMFYEVMPGFGKLKKNHKLALVAAMGSDVAGIYKNIVKNQNAFCPSDDFSRSNLRPGYLRSDGLCFPNFILLDNPNGKKVNGEPEQIDPIRFFSMFQSFTTGKPVPVFSYDKLGNEIETKASWSAPFLNPVPDLKTLFPATYNDCDKGKSYKDPTLGGIFPNGDAEAHMIRTNNLDRSCEK